MKGATTAVRLEAEEKAYLLEGARLEAPGADMGLSTFLRTAGHQRTHALLGVTFEEWRAQKKPKKAPR